MKILFLDDDENRIEAFKKKTSPGWDITITKTAKETIDVLKNNNSWNYVFLDHDLGGQVFVDSDREDCGMEVVRWITRNRPEIELIIVHSWNEPASKRMISDLEMAGYNVVYSPFGMS